MRKPGGYISLPVISLLEQNVRLLNRPISTFPANRRCPNTGLMLGQRRRRWASIKPILGQRLVIAGWVVCYNIHEQ